jgi:antitoxin component of MazEF toxin-antitoxin module
LRQQSSAVIHRTRLVDDGDTLEARNRIMVKKLTKHGNSLALIIDRPILDLLKIDPETPLDVSTDGRQLIISPAKASARRGKFDAAQEWTHQHYGKSFRKLAE